MGLFNRNKKGDTKQSDKANNKKKSFIKTLFHESVPGTALDDFAANTPFIAEKDGETKYVGLLLNTADIGGFDKKSTKDEAKGSIIECINSGRIKAFITAELLDKECLVIIPDNITLSAMEEFGLLSDAPYELVYVDKDGMIENTGVNTTWKEASDIILNNSNVSVIEGLDLDDDSSNNSESNDIEDDDDIDDNTDIPDDEYIEEDEENNDYEKPFDGDIEDKDGDDTYDVDTPDGDDELDDDTENTDVDDDDAIDKPTDTVSEEEIDEIPKEMIYDTIVRKFYSDDLGLEVSTDPFDSQFLHYNDFVPFNENRGEGFLNEYLSQMSKNANAEMRKFHQDNLFRIRERYFKLVSMHCEEIYKALDTSDINTPFGEMANNLKSQKINAESDINRLVSEKKTEMEDAWENKLNQIAEDAARMAKQQYRDRFGRQHEDDIYHIEPNIKEQIANEYADAVAEMHDNRRVEASKRLDYGINETLREVSDMYMDMIEEEQNRYYAIQKEMHDFIDNNRQDEIARSRVLAEELAQNDKATSAIKECEEKLRRQSAEFDANRIALKNEIEVIQRKATDAVREKELNCNAKLFDVNEHNKELQARVDELLEQYSVLDNKKSQEYSSRINELSNERQAWEDKCNHVIEVHKKSNMISGLLVGVAVVAAIAIGFIGGEFTHINSNNQDSQSSLIQEFNKHLDETDNKNNSAYNNNYNNNANNNSNNSFNNNSNNVNNNNSNTNTNIPTGTITK